MQLTPIARSPRRALLVGTVALGVILAACGDDDAQETTATPTTAVNAPGDSTGTTMAGDMGDHNDADVAFATGMIPHHRQAVAMAEIVLEKSDDPEVIDLAQRIKAAQDPEIETMTGWLESWGAPVPDEPTGGMDHGTEGSTSDTDMGGDGMMSAEEMAALEAATPPELEQLFMEGMIRHHEGAIAMAETELAEGTFPDAKALAENIIDAQQAEIDEMEALLAAR